MRRRACHPTKAFSGFAYARWQSGGRHCIASHAWLHRRKSYREKAERTLGLLAGIAGQYGLFAGTYGIAATYAVYPHSQIVIVGEDETAAQLYSQAASSALIGRSAIKLKFCQAVAQNLPPSLAATIPDLPAMQAQKTTAVVCSGFSCKPPVNTPEQLGQLLMTESSAANA